MNKMLKVANRTEKNKITQCVLQYCEVQIQVYVFIKSCLEKHKVGTQNCEMVINKTRRLME